MLIPGSADASAPPATEIAGVTEFAGPSEPPPETEIGEAAAARREGSFVPASSSHLTVVHVSVSACGDRSIGSGVVVADGLILTAAHIVGDAALVRIDVGQITITGEVVGVLGDGRDVALVAVDAPMDVPLVAATAPALGDAITLVGHPAGGPRTTSVGPRVDIAPVVAEILDGEILGVDASVSRGMSGGPAINSAGDIVGLLVAKEGAGDMALVVALPDLGSIESQALVPGSCQGSA